MILVIVLIDVFNVINCVTCFPVSVMVGSSVSWRFCMDLMMNVVVLLSSMVVVLMEVVLLVSGDRCDGVRWDDSFLNDGNFLLLFVDVVWNMIILLKLMFDVLMYLLYVMYLYC